MRVRTSESGPSKPGSTLHSSRPGSSPDLAWFPEKGSASPAARPSATSALPPAGLTPPPDLARTCVAWQCPIRPAPPRECPRGKREASRATNEERKIAARGKRPQAGVSAGCNVRRTERQREWPENLSGGEAALTRTRFPESRLPATPLVAAGVWSRLHCNDRFLPFRGAGRETAGSRTSLPQSALRARAVRSPNHFCLTAGAAGCAMCQAWARGRGGGIKTSYFGPGARPPGGPGAVLAHAPWPLLPWQTPPACTSAAESEAQN